MVVTVKELSIVGSPSDRILAATKKLRTKLLEHSIYHRIQDMGSLQTFMQHHAFAVLDFMWLLKRLQRDLCCNDVPWLPVANPELSRFVNEIVLGEESDEDGNSGFCSHFEMYLQAMKDVGTSCHQINRFVERLRVGQPVGEALKSVAVCESVCEFVEFTHSVATEGSAADVAVVFCFGREDIIPDMFNRMLLAFESSGMQVSRLAYYIRRHIELDGDHHGPLTRKMVDMLCESESVIASAIQTAQKAISLRIRLWDGVLSELRSNLNPR